MAISQHQFYLDRKQSKAKITSARSLGDIAMDLTETGAPRISKLVCMESKDKLIMASNGSLGSSNSADNEVNEEQKKEKIAELKNKQKKLEDLLAQKLDELKKICLREAELTGTLPKEYPQMPGEKPPTVRRRVGTAFKLDDLFPYDADPNLRNLESRFALQKKIVEAAHKLAHENELCKTVRKKRRRNLLDATKKLQEIENEINDHRVKIGKEPTQRASVIIADNVSLDNLSDCLTLEDDEPSQRSRSRSVQYSQRPNSTNPFPAQFHSDRIDPLIDSNQDYTRLNYSEVQESLGYTHGNTLSAHSSPYHQPSCHPHDSRSMPPTPQLPRNAYSSIQLSSHFRQRSGSLESQSQFPTDSEPPESVFPVSPPRRSNSTEILDDGSSYTSQSSVEYSGNIYHSRAQNRHRRRQGNIYANTGSMPNLAQNDSRCYTSQPRHHPTTTAYYVTGYPQYLEPEMYNRDPYVYETEVEGHYNVNGSYHRNDPHGMYGQDEMDGMAQNVYATFRPSRNRPPSRNEHVGKSMQRSEVVEHLRGWFNRQHRQPGYDTYRHPQQNVGYRTISPGYVRSDSTASYSTVSSGNWNGRPVMRMPHEYEMPIAHHQSYGYATVHHGHSLHSSPDPHLLPLPPDPLLDTFPPEFGWMTPGRRSPLPMSVEVPGAVGSDYEQEYFL